MRQALYREEMFTDRKVGAIRRLTPVTADGAPDTTRPVLFVGQAEIMTNMGPVPLSFEIEGKTLAEAVAGFLRCRNGRDRAHRATDPGDAAAGGFAAGRAPGRHAEPRPGRPGRPRRREDSDSMRVRLKPDPQAAWRS